ncbi:MAG: helix-turn-helix transcriptional regulator [Coriobacteriales bacterium]
MESLDARIERAEGEPAGHLDARLLGLGLLVASDLMLLNAFSPANVAADVGHPQGVPFHVAELLAFLAGALACALLWLAVGSRAGRRDASAAPAACPEGDSGRPARPWGAPLVACALLSAVGLALAWAHDAAQAPAQPLALAVAGGAAMGAANTLAALLWGRVYASLGTRRCLAHAAVSCALGVTLSLLPALASAGAALVHPLVWSACQALCLVLLTAELRQGAVGLAVVRADGAPEEGVRDAGRAARPQWRGRDDEGSQGAGSERAGFRQMASYLWGAVAGQAVFAFLLGVFWRAYSEAVFYAWGLETCVAWAAALLMAALAVFGGRLTKPVGFGALYRVAMPVGALLLVADPFLSLVGVGEMFVTSGVFWTVCLMSFFVVAWTAIAQACREGGRPSDPATCVARAAWVAALAAGVLAGSALDSFGVKLVATTLIVAYLAALLVWQFVLSGRQREQVEAARAQAGEGMQEWAARIARDHGLSERETTVFELLAQGHGETFISERLSISPNTVKTHRKHIYRKLGISSREELLDFVSRSLG